MVIKRIDFIFYTILCCVSFLTFYPLIYTFYQQDEWMTHGHFLVEGPFAYVGQYSLLGLLAGGGRLPAQLIQYFLFMVFPFNISLISIVSIVVHTANSILIYHITRKVLKQRLAAGIAAIFFLTASSAHQAVTWIGASTTTLPSAFFALLSIWYYLQFLKSEHTKDLVFSFASLFLSYFMKQTSIFLFVFYPFLYLFRKRISIKTVKKTVAVHIPLIIFIIGIVAPLFIGFFFTEHTSENVFTNKNPMGALLSHVIFYPINALSQMYFFPAAMFSIAREFFADASETTIQTVHANTASSIVSLLLIGAIGAVSYVAVSYRKILLMGLLFTLMTFLPFVALEKVHAYLDSRYYYLGAAGGGFLLAVFGLAIFGIAKKKFGEYTAQISIALLVMLFALYSGRNIYFIRRDIGVQTDVAQKRIVFLKMLDAQLPALPANPAIYITGNTEYLIPDSYVPFQQGMGFTLMTWYYPKGNVPSELIKTDFLWQLGGEGYSEIEGSGFGYYSRFETLQKDYAAGTLQNAEIVGLYYDASKMEVYNITDEVMAQLQKT